MTRAVIPTEAEIKRALKAFAKLGVPAAVEFTADGVRVVPVSDGKRKVAVPKKDLVF